MLLTEIIFSNKNEKFLLASCERFPGIRWEFRNDQ